MSSEEELINDSEIESLINEEKFKELLKDRTFFDMIKGHVDNLARKLNRVQLANKLACLVVLRTKFLSESS